MTWNLFPARAGNRFQVYRKTVLKLSELRELSRQELKDKARALKKSLFEMRSQASTGRIEKPDKIREARRDIARILTVINEKK